MPLLFDFHGDILSRLKTALPGKVRHMDANEGVPFNPLRLSSIQSQSPRGWMDNVFAVADIFAGVFSDFGDVQISVIRTHLITAYQDAGFRRQQPGGDLSAPPFRRFYDLMRAHDRLSVREQNIIARLDVLFQLDLFTDTDEELGIEELCQSPTVLDLHRIGSEHSQLAIASFFLQKVYKHMFEAGESERLRLAVIFDEAHRASKLQLLGTMMQESRKFGVMMIVSSQRISDFASRVTDSVGSHLALKVQHTDAKTLSAMLAGMEGRARVQRTLLDLPKYHALFRSEDYIPYVKTELRSPAE